MTAGPAPEVTVPNLKTLLKLGVSVRKLRDERKMDHLQTLQNEDLENLNSMKVDRFHKPEGPQRPQYNTPSNFLKK